MNREQACADVVEELIKEVRLKYPGNDPFEIASELGLKIIYEKPVPIGSAKRISELRPKTGEIVVFHKEHEQEAIAHELFHYFESIKKIKASEKNARIFAKMLTV